MVAHSARMLVVVHEKTAFEQWQQHGSRHYIAVDCVSSWQEAEIMLQHQSFQVIVVNQQLLPGGDGIYLAKLNQRQLDAITILILTQHDFAQLWQTFYLLDIPFVLTADSQLHDIDFILNKALARSWERQAQRQVQHSLLTLGNQLTRQQEQLQQWQQQHHHTVVIALLKTAVARGHESLQHCQRVAEISQSLATQLGMTDKAITVIQQAALLHDLGLLAIPETMLHHSGALSSEAWALMHQHPQWGAEIIASIPTLTEVAALVQQHHERYNGSGYPAQLAGEQILLGARILAIADTIDSLLSWRSYRQAYDFNTAMMMIVQDREQKFDPLVIQALQGFKQNYFSTLQSQYPEPERVKPIPSMIIAPTGSKSMPPLPRV